MSNITVNFSNVTLSSSNTTIAVTGGSFALDAANPLSVSGTVSFSSMYVTTGAISFNVESGATFNAAVQVPLTAGAGQTPAIEVTNFQGTVTVTWPTSTGMSTQALESGNSLMLSGFAG